MTRAIGDSTAIHVDALLDATGLELRELARLLGCNRSTLYRWTTTHPTPPYVAGQIELLRDATASAMRCGRARDIIADWRRAEHSEPSEAFARLARLGLELRDERAAALASAEAVLQRYTAAEAERAARRTPEEIRAQSDALLARLDKHKAELADVAHAPPPATRQTSAARKLAGGKWGTVCGERTWDGTTCTLRNGHKGDHA